MITHPITTSELCVYEFDLSKELDFVKLRENCINHVENYGPKYHPGHSSIKSSGFFTHAVTHEFDNLIKIIEEKTNMVSDQLSGVSGVKAHWSVLETWVLLYKKLGYVHDHNHYPFGFSAVCYVSAENTAPIWFHDKEIQTKTGQLLIFPGYVKHRVKPLKPNHSERIVFASNLYATFDTSILQRNASYGTTTNSNNFYFDFLGPMDVTENK